MNLSVLTLTPISCEPRMSGCSVLLMGLKSETAAASRRTPRVHFPPSGCEYFNVLFHSGSTLTCDPLHYQAFFTLIPPLKPPSHTRLYSSWGGRNPPELSHLQEGRICMRTYLETVEKPAAKQQHCKKKNAVKNARCVMMWAIQWQTALYASEKWALAFTLLGSPIFLSFFF